MSASKKEKAVLEDMEVSLKLKLAALWSSLMFLYLYVDYFHFYMPGEIQRLMTGVVFQFEITQRFLLIVLASMTIPALMIFLSVALPARLNRTINITIAMVYIPYTLFNLAGVAWLHMVFGAIVEVALLCLIIRYAWRWPRVEIRL